MVGVVIKATKACASRIPFAPVFESLFVLFQGITGFFARILFFLDWRLGKEVPKYYKHELNRTDGFQIRPGGLLLRGEFTPGNQ